MTTVRKLITFPAHAVALLDSATAGSQQRAVGDYLAAVLRQRRTAWADALDHLSRRVPRARILQALELAGGVDPSYRDHGRLRQTLSECVRVLDPPALIIHEEEQEEMSMLVAAFCDLLVEYNAGNRALRTALEET